MKELAAIAARKDRQQSGGSSGTLDIKAHPSTASSVLQLLLTSPLAQDTASEVERERERGRQRKQDEAVALPTRPKR